MNIELSNGLTLQLQPVSQVAIDEIIADLGGYELQSRLAEMHDAALRAHFGAYTKDEMADYLAAQHRQMLYCFGWGVVDDPPQDALDALDLLGKNHRLPAIRRANWLIYVAGISRPDKSQIIGHVMALTYATELRRANG